MATPLNPENEPQPKFEAEHKPIETMIFPAGQIPVPGAAPGIELHELLKRPSGKERVRVTCIDYCPDKFQSEEVTDFTGFIRRHRPEWSLVRWINISGLSDMAVMRVFAEKYELHPLAVEDVLSNQRPKVDDYPESAEHPGRLFVVAWMMQLQEKRPRREQISFFLGRHTLITFQQNHGDVFDPIRRRIESAGSRLRQNDVSFLLYSLLDAIVDHFFPVLDHYSTRLEKLERGVLKRPDASIINRIYRARRELVVLRRTASAMRDLIHQMHREPHEGLSATTQTYLRDVYDHVIQVFEFIETYREFVGSLAETYLSVTSNRLNEIMKTLTIINTIFVPLTFLAGVYGMNMHIPENRIYGMYFIFWGICAMIVGSMIWWIRRRRWY